MAWSEQPLERIPWWPKVEIILYISRLFLALNPRNTPFHSAFDWFPL